MHLQVDVCESMGANCVNTVAEGLAPLIAHLFQCRIGLKIVSNLCAYRVVEVGATVVLIERVSHLCGTFQSAFCIPLKHLAYKGVAGNQVAQRILEAYEWADDDPFRAVTHNKGIMNGMDAVALATGQDWRALEAAAHAWIVVRSMDGVVEGTVDRPVDPPVDNARQYKELPYLPLKDAEPHYGSLTQYWIDNNQEGESCLHGRLRLPVSVGVKGGSMQSNPTMRYTHGLLRNPSARELSEVCFDTKSFSLVILPCLYLRHFSLIRLSGILLETKRSWCR